MSSPIRIYLADLTYTTLSLANEAFPLGIGYIGAYCKEKLGDCVDIQLFKYIEKLEECIRQDPPDILGMSNYPWNFQIGLEFFRLIDRISPSTIKVMGGPNIPLDMFERDKFIRRYPEIDFYAYLEGEDAFTNLVARTIERGFNRTELKKDPVEGMIHLNQGELVRGLFLPRRKTLDEIPSPYLTGTLDKFFDGKLAPLLETNRGCPFRCTFCHEGSTVMTKVNYFPVDRIKMELDYIAERIPESAHNLMFADPNFAMYERDYEICEHVSKIQVKQGWPTAIFASTGKNKKERIAKALRILNGTMRLWMSVQSMDDDVLKEIKRSNIKLDKMIGLREVFAEMGLPTSSELILALPGDTAEKHTQSIAAIVDADVDYVCTYTLMLLNGTELGLPISRKKYDFGTHFRVLPRDFGKLSDGTISIEIEEVVTSSNTMPFEDYIKMRMLHLIVNVVYNGKAYAALFDFLRSEKITVFNLLYKLVNTWEQAHPDVIEIVKSFAKKTKTELWDSEAKLREYLSIDENYQKLVNEEMGENLIQTHIARSMRVMTKWTEFVFKSVMGLVKSNKHIFIKELEKYCSARVHNLWGESREEDNPKVTFENYDIPKWNSDRSINIREFKLDRPAEYVFKFDPETSKEVNRCIKRYGTTNTGIGRILVRLESTKSIWRRAVGGFNG